MASGILYTAVVDKGQLVAEYEVAKRNSKSFALAIASQAKPGTRMSYASDSLAGHYLARQSGLVIVVVCDQSTPRRVPLALLKAIDQNLGDVTPLDPKRVAGVLETTTRNFKGEDALQISQSEIDQVKNVMVENVDRLLERGERISLLVDRTQEMNTSANLFRRRAAQVQRKFWWQNVRLLLFAGLCIFAVVFLLYMIS